MKIEIDEQDFGTLCICAVRYCHGRQTYMPSFVQEIITPYLKKLSYNDLIVMLNDCADQEKYPHLYGNMRIDQPGWVKWREKLNAEKERRDRETERKYGRT